MLNEKYNQSRLFDISQSYVEAAFALIADETPGGAERFAAFALKALSAYESGFLTRLTRGRGNEVRAAIEQIKEHPEAVKRLPEFKTLIQKGKWETTSYNFCLFVELIKELGGYDYLYHNRLTVLYVDLLKDAVLKQIDYFMKEQERNKEVVNQRQTELNKIRPVFFKELEKKLGVKSEDDSHFRKLLLLINPTEDNKELIKQNKRATFVLRREYKNTTLCWINILGTIREIKLNEYPDLAAWLQNHPDPLNLDHITDLKKHLLCVRTTHELDTGTLKDMASKLALRLGQPAPEKQKSNESQINVCFILTDPDPLSLAEQGMGRSFIINRASKSLWWIGDYNACTVISLEKYPMLNQWLDAHTAALNEDEMIELKSLLGKVNTIDESKQNIVATMLASRSKKTDGPIESATCFNPHETRLKPEFLAELSGLFQPKRERDLASEDEVLKEFSEAMGSKSIV